MRKIAAFGDIHISTKNRLQVDEFEAKVVLVLKEVMPDTIVLLGDILNDHERINSQALNRAIKFIEEMTKIAPTYVLVGNHCMYNNSQFLNSNHWMNCLKKWKPNPGEYPLMIVDKVHLNEEKDIAFVPYVAPGRFLEALHTCLKPPEVEDLRVIFAHQEFKGCKMGAFVSEIGDEWGDDMPFVVSGHIHENQQVGEVYYPGSCIQHSQSGSGGCVIAVLQLKDEEIELEELTVQTARRVTILINDPLKELDTLKVPDDVLPHMLKVIISFSPDTLPTIKKHPRVVHLQKLGVNIMFKKCVEKNIGQISGNGMTEAWIMKSGVRPKFDFHSHLQGLIEAESEDKEGMKSLYDALNSK